MQPERSLLRLGTSSWSCADWAGKFYTAGTEPRDFIAEYARKFDTVEIDSSFYAAPRKSVVEGWRERTPETFTFSAKAPQVITHEKFLVNCDAEVRSFLDTMSALGPRMGPILLQFPYYSRKSGVAQDEFLRRLRAFLPTLAAGHAWVVEVRNKAWIGESLFDILRPLGIPLALIDHPWMSRPDELFAMDGILTGPFAYIRWLGDRYGIEKITTTWNDTVVDRRKDLERWIPHIEELVDKRYPIFGYVNNHYAGYAPAMVELIQQMITKA